MSLLHISDAFKTYLETPGRDKKYLAYIDFRQQLYPPLSGHGLTFHAFPDNMIDRGHCEASTEPMVIDETTAVTSNATWGRSSTEYYRGNYSWLMTKTSAGGAGDALVYLVDGTGTTDLHGFEAGKKYRYSLKVKTSDHANYRFQVYEYSGGWHQLVSDQLTASDTWETVSGTFELEIDSAAIYIRNYIASVADAAETAYIDEIKIDEENQTGSHVGYFGNLASDPHPQYCLDLPDYFTFWIRCKPYFAYNTAETHILFSWYISATIKLYLAYAPASDQFLLMWEDNGDARGLYSQQYDDGSSHSDINQWIDIVGVIDLRTGGRTTGSSLWTDWTKRDSSWNGNHDEKTSNFPILNIGHYHSADEFDGEIAFFKLWPEFLASDAEIAAYFRTVKNEEIYFPLNGHGVGHTRCNISYKILDANIELTKKSRKDAWIANKGGLTLDNHDGIFSDDQYAAFDAALEQYNGLATQTYMQQRCGLELEILYTSEVSIEPLFTGRVDEKGFARSSDAGKSRVNIGFEDMIQELLNVGIEKSVSYEDYQFCKPADESASLIHVIARLVTAPKIYNYASNSSFENATIGNSWANTNLSAWTRESGGLFGTYLGRMVYDNGAGGVQDIHQTVMFNRDAGDEKLNPGDKWTFSIYLKSASACNYNITVEEADSGGENDSTDETYTLAGGEGWVRFDVTHEVTDSDSDRLVIRVEMNDNVTLDVDGAMLIKSDEPYNWFILNADDGSSGSYNSDDAIDNDRYDTYEKCGFDTVASALVHPWAAIYTGNTVWNYLEKIAKAMLARSLGIDTAGTFRYRSRYEEEDGKDPSAIEDIIDNVISIGSTIEKTAYNHIIIRGCYIVKSTAYKILWSAYGSIAGVYKHSEAIQIEDNAYWPSLSTYGPFLAEFQTGPVMDWVVDWLQDITDYALIGVQNAYGLGQTLKADLTGCDLTQIIFDTRPDGVYIKYRNDCGEKLYMWSYQIRGQPVHKVGGEKAVNSGFVHDYFKDLNAIRRSGEKKFELASDFLINKTQIEKVAEYHWKNRNARHRYRKALGGNRLYLLPGEWVNVAIGSAGFHEYLDYKGEMRETHWSWNTRGEESTDVIIDEQESNWKAESNYSARFQEYGYPYKDPEPQGQTLVVASKYSAEVANFYCDGTSDEDEINSAINALYNQGGGTVQLTRGTFYISAAIEMKSKVVLKGVGSGTILEKNCNDHCIEADGASGTEITNIRIADLKITTNASDTNSNKYHIWWEYVDKSSIENVYCHNAYHSGIRLEYCDNNKVVSNVIDTTVSAGTGMVLTNSCNDNEITNNHCLGGGASNGGGMYVWGARNIISHNFCSNNDGDGLYIQGHDITVNNNQCYNNNSDGIYLYNADDCIISANICNDNGAYGIIVSNVNCSRCVVTGNRATGNTTADITDQGTNTTISGNDYN